MPLPQSELTNLLAAAVAWEQANGAQIRWTSPYTVNIDRRSTGDKVVQGTASWMPGSSTLLGWAIKRAVRSPLRYILSIDDYGELKRTVF